MDPIWRSGRKSGALFAGTELSASGKMVEVYIDPRQLESARRVRRNLLPLAGMAGAAGITGKQLGCLIDEFGRRLDSTPISRINFLKIAAVGSLTACGGDGSGITDPSDNGNTPTDPVAPVPVITGPSEVSIPGLGKDVLIGLDAANTQGRVTAYEWKGTILNNEIEIEAELSLGEESTASYLCSRPGTLSFQLTAYNSWANNTATHEVTVHPAELPSQPYSLPMLFQLYEDVSGKLVPALYAANPGGSAATRPFGTRDMNTTRVNWEPSGERVVFSLEKGPTEALHTFSLLTGEIKKITENVNGTAEAASVSPKGEWVAYLDDSRRQALSGSEVALVRLDGTGQFYLSGDVTSDKYGRGQPSWDKDGGRIAVAEVLYDLAGEFELGNRWARRIGIFGDLWSGNPTRDDYLPSEEQLERFWARGDYEVTHEDFFHTLNFGPNGLAWSPDGLKVVYDMQFGWIPENHHVLALSNVDGTGDIQSLATSGGIDFNVDFFLPNNPTWSADGKAIYFMAFSHFEKGLYQVKHETGNLSRVLSSYPGQNPSLYD